MDRSENIMDILGNMYSKTKTGLNFRSPFESLIATILSAQTTDIRVNKTTPYLFGRYPTPYELAEADPNDVSSIIKEIGLHRTKARHIVQSAKMIVDHFHGEVPKTMNELLLLPGVGRKTANVVLSNAFNIPALAVDTHVYRVSKRLGLAQGNSATQVEKELKDLLPTSQWILAHRLLIQHGRHVCRARLPLCNQCCLRDLCPSSSVNNQ